VKEFLFRGCLRPCDKQLKVFEGSLRRTFRWKFAAIKLFEAY